MNIWQAIIEALQSLVNNKMRAGLTILGIVIGVAAVIAMLAVGAGAQNSITGSINGIGSNLIFVISGNRQVTIRNPKPLTMSDATALGDPLQAPHVFAAAPVVTSSVSLTYGGESTNTSLFGATPDYLTMRNMTLSEGTTITQDNQLGQASVVILGSQTADKLFGRHDGVTGEIIRIEGQPFRVIGVLTTKGGGGFGGSQDDQAVVPLSTAQSRLVKKRVYGAVDMILVQATGPDTVSQATDEINVILSSRHHTIIGAEDFTLTSQQDIVGIAQSITGVLTVFLGGIAGISLLVGGIGIMNIMLVSVTERTREIGLRKAIGARKRDILTQFLTESALLSFIGGLIGIGLGWLIAFVVGKVAAASGTALTPSVSLDAILLATIFSTAVGLFFGIYPANRAANLEPVEALRSE
jgi:putative ABC transport system permease protein